MREVLPVIIASYQRLGLLKQTIESIRENSYHDVKIIVVDNSTDKKVIRYLESLSDITLFRWGTRKKYPHLRVWTPDGFFYPPEQQPSPYWTEKWSLGKTRTMGAILAPPSNYLYFCDNDMYHTKDWDKWMVKALKDYPGMVMVGGSGQYTTGADASPVGKDHTVSSVSLQVGNTMMVRRQEWSRIGYFPDYDEDTWISREISDRYKKTPGEIKPWVVIHCGIKSFFTGGAINFSDEKTLTYDTVNIGLNKIKYPELLYE